MELNKYFDHTKLGFYCSEEDIKKLCEEAKKYNFKSVCVNPVFVKLAKELLKGTDVLVCTVVGFPHGAQTTKTKVYETLDALANGADEIDMVINVSDLKNGHVDKVEDEIRQLKQACMTRHCKNTTLKVIIEACLLTDEEKVLVSKACVNAGADFVKTSTGYSTSGAKVEDIKLIRSVVQDKCFIKASGGIHTKEQTLALIEAGADRIGASKSVQIMEGKESNGNTSY